jgi:septum formation protein
VALRRGTAWKTIGKPQDRTEAGAMLRELAGKTHSVFTGLCLLERKSGRRQISTSASTVRFSGLSEDEIEGCLDTGEWKGAAGAYRIQGFGSCIVEELKGSWSCVVGLPIRELYAMLGSAGIEIMQPHRTERHPLEVPSPEADAGLGQGKGA